ncbi:uncharacterized protein VTP21DRAFT_8508 [Calcarisporiella thermophila]|uniref:uncharacterized protein n=1 Tax=Calcarisporiella thermophila TaxID=911321 RepID=UPI003743077F
MSFLPSIASGDISTARNLIEQGANVNGLFSWNSNRTRSPVIPDEILNGNPAALQAIQESVDYEITPLNLAVLCGREEMVNLLLDSGSDVNLKDGRGRTPLVCAIYGLDAMTITTQNLPLISQSHPKHLAVIEKCLLFHPNISRETLNDPQKAIRGITPLCLASYLGKEPVLRLLLEMVGKGIDIDATDYNGATPLMYGARDGHLHVVRLLLQHGASPDCTDHHGWSSIQYGQSYPGIVRVCEEALRCRRPRIKDKNIALPSINYPQNYSRLLSLLSSLVEMPAERSPEDEYTADSTTHQALLQAIRLNDHVSIEALLLSPPEVAAVLPTNVALVNFHDKTTGLTPLHHAVRQTQPSLETLMLLYQAGADMNARTMYGRTVLHHLCRLTAGGKSPKRERSRQKLSEQPSQQSLQSQGTPKEENRKPRGSVSSGSSDGVDNHQQQSSPQQKSPPKQSQTHQANGFSGNGKPALENGIEESSAHLARCASLLIQLGCEVNVVDRYGYTPLHFAVEYGGVREVVRVLMEAGANWEAKNAKGLTPLEAAKEGMGPSLQELIDVQKKKAAEQLEKDREPFDHVLQKLTDDHASSISVLEVTLGQYDSLPPVTSTKSPTRISLDRLVDSVRQKIERSSNLLSDLTTQYQKVSETFSGEKTLGGLAAQRLQDKDVQNLFETLENGYELHSELIKANQDLNNKLTEARENKSRGEKGNEGKNHQDNEKTSTKNTMLDCPLDPKRSSIRMMDQPWRRSTTFSTLNPTLTDRERNRMSRAISPLTTSITRVRAKLMDLERMLQSDRNDIVLPERDDLFSELAKLVEDNVNHVQQELDQRHAKLNDLVEQIDLAEDPAAPAETKVNKSTEELLELKKELEVQAFQVVEIERAADTLHQRWEEVKERVEKARQEERESRPKLCLPAKLEIVRETDANEIGENEAALLTPPRSPLLDSTDRILLEHQQWDGGQQIESLEMEFEIHAANLLEIQHEVEAIDRRLQDIRGQKKENYEKCLALDKIVDGNAPAEERKKAETQRELLLRQTAQLFDEQDKLNTERQEFEREFTERLQCLNLVRDGIIRAKPAELLRVLLNKFGARDYASEPVQIIREREDSGVVIYYEGEDDGEGTRVEEKENKGNDLDNKETDDEEGEEEKSDADKLVPKLRSKVKSIESSLRLLQARAADQLRGLGTSLDENSSDAPPSLTAAEAELDDCYAQMAKLYEELGELRRQIRSITQNTPTS